MQRNGSAIALSTSVLIFYFPFNQPATRVGQFFHVKLNNCIANQDSGRQGSEVLISPNKMYSAVKDSRNRILLVDNYSRTIVQMWRGYHRYSTQRLYTLYIGNVTTTHTQTKCGLLFYIKLTIFSSQPRKGNSYLFQMHFTFVSIPSILNNYLFFSAAISAFHFILHMN